MEYNILRRIFDERTRDILDTYTDILMCIEKLSGEYKFRVLPYKTLGHGPDLLISFQPDEVYINGKILKGALVAVSMDTISDGGVYSAIASASAGGI